MIHVGCVPSQVSQVVPSMMHAIRPIGPDNIPPETVKSDAGKDFAEGCGTHTVPEALKSWHAADVGPPKVSRIKLKSFITM